VFDLFFFKLSILLSDVSFFCYYIFQTPLIIYLFHFVVDYAELVFMVSTLFLLFVFSFFLHHWTVQKKNQLVATIPNVIYHAIFSAIFKLFVNFKQKGVWSKNMS